MVFLANKKAVVMRTPLWMPKNVECALQFHVFRASGSACLESAYRNQCRWTSCRQPAF